MNNLEKWCVTGIYLLLVWSVAVAPVSSSIRHHQCQRARAFLLHAYSLRQLPLDGERVYVRCAPNLKDKYILINSEFSERQQATVARQKPRVHWNVNPLPVCVCVCAPGTTLHRTHTHMFAVAAHSVDLRARIAAHLQWIRWRRNSRHTVLVIISVGTAPEQTNYTWKSIYETRVFIVRLAVA